MTGLDSLRSLLAHPLTRGLDLDDPRTTELRRRIIREKKFLRRIYDDWYGLIRARIPAGPGAILELGSGAGHFRQFVPEVIQSEVFACKNAQLVSDARALPFSEGSLKSIVMTDVFHHIPDVRAFLREAVRCLRQGGRLTMVEPWVTPWSKVVFTHLHHEPFLPMAEDWSIPASGPLSGANGALPWIVFRRDRARFESEFGALRIREIRPMMPLRYLVSGGVAMRDLMPGWLYGFWRALEAILSPCIGQTAMFALIDIERK
jgi:SAM-dependent methyltransferase